MGENSLSVLAIACSIAALSTSLVVALRSTPQRVRKAAYDALQLAEEMQNGFLVASNRMVSFMEEVTRERASARADVEEAERKRRQAAAKMSKVNASEAQEAERPKSLREVLDTLPAGDPRRLALLRRSNMTASDEG
ncbi:MAG TPA: hypothetical protein ENH89_13475 [Aurantimonas coralicida]|uniref:Uncharacterized protein n=1 Tax=Aurantimonas coralicida TaxID=182270 RepID=A0A9C9NHC5_9HYPH|nr:hypothetical protein [Aurantimonas coralicida]